MQTTATEVLDVLSRYVSRINAQVVLKLSMSRLGTDLERLESGKLKLVPGEIRSALKIFLADGERKDHCISEIMAVLAGGENTLPDSMTLPVKREVDIVSARQAGSQVCEELGFSASVQTRVATAISELARNIVNYAGEGVIELTILQTGRRGVEIIARDEGPGIEDVEKVLSGRYRSKTGMGMGLLGTKRLMDEFEIDTRSGKGTTVRIRKYLQ
jgi:serine/threonine-protein kinase RsbT